MSEEQKKEESKTITAIVPTMCPHCGKENLTCINLQQKMWVHWCLSRENIKKAKNNVKEKILKIKFNNKKEQEDIIKWLDDETTMFGPDTVDQVLLQLIQGKEKKENKVEKK